MRELVSLAGRHVRTALRARAAWVLGVVYLLALVAVGLFPASRSGGGGTLVFLVLGTLAAVLGGVAASAGGALPGDRQRGRTEWLGSLAPARWKHRIAVVLATFVLTLGCGLLGGIGAGATLSLTAPDFEVRTSRPVVLPRDESGARLVLTAASEGLLQGPSVTISLPEGPRAGDARLEIDVRPRVEVDPDAGHGAATLVDTLPIWIRIDGQAPERRIVSVRRPLRIALVPTATSVTLANQGTTAHLRLLRARILGAERSPFLAMVLAGLLLGLMASAVAPLAVFLSRFTSGATASAAALALLLFGSAKGALLGLASDLAYSGATAWAFGVLELVGTIAPRIEITACLTELAGGRSFDTVRAWGLLPLLLYAAAGLLLVAVPMPGAVGEREVAS
jgi:hypothetical protein